MGIQSRPPNNRLRLRSTALALQGIPKRGKLSLFVLVIEKATLHAQAAIRIRAGEAMSGRPMERTADQRGSACVGALLIGGEKAVPA